jgi:hypothetical protein
MPGKSSAQFSMTFKGKTYSIDESTTNDSFLAMNRRLVFEVDAVEDFASEYLDINATVHVALNNCSNNRSFPVVGYRLPLTISQDGASKSLSTETSTTGAFTTKLLPLESDTTFSMTLNGKSFTTIESISSGLVPEKVVFKCDTIEVDTPMGKGKLVNLPTVDKNSFAVKLEWGAIGYFREVTMTSFC